MFLSFINWKKNCSECDSNNIVPLCCYRYSCGVDFPILTKLEQLLKLYSYHYSYHALCELALTAMNCCMACIKIL